MTHIRYHEAPVDRQPDRPDIITNDPAVIAQYEELTAARSALSAEVRRCQAELENLNRTAGERVINGADVRELGGQIRDLRSDLEIFEAAGRFVNGKIELLYRVHGWLRR